MITIYRVLIDCQGLLHNPYYYYCSLPLKMPRCVLWLKCQPSQEVFVLIVDMLCVWCFWEVAFVFSLTRQFTREPQLRCIFWVTMYYKTDSTLACSEIPYQVMYTYTYSCLYYAIFKQKICKCTKDNAKVKSNNRQGLKEALPLKFRGDICSFDLYCGPVLNML